MGPQIGAGALLDSLHDIEHTIVIPGLIMTHGTSVFG